jgi:large subunit ribosomal protein L30
MPKKKAKLCITLRRSGIGACPNARRTLVALGLKRPQQSVTRPANDAVRGMLTVVQHLVTVEEV